jgi:hypothetical protein
MIGATVAETRSTGRRRNSETSVTTTGVSAALRTVPEPQRCEAAKAAAAEATLATERVPIEMPPRRSWRALAMASCSGSLPTSARGSSGTGSGGLGGLGGLGVTSA